MAANGAFDPAGGESGKADGMRRAARGASPAWKTYIAELIVEVARRKPFFTTDDVERLRIMRQGPRTHEQRALGPMMRAAAHAGICVRTDDHVESQMRDNHRRPKRVWYSLIYRGPPIRRPGRRRIHDPRQYDLLPQEEENPNVR